MAYNEMDKETREKIDALLNEKGISTKKELNLDDLENVSGGRLFPHYTHEEVDKMCDALKIILDKYGANVAQDQAYEWGFTSSKSWDIPGKNVFCSKNPQGELEHLRHYIHDKVDGKRGNGLLDGWVPENF